MNKLSIDPKVIQSLLTYDDNGILVINRNADVYATSSAIQRICRYNTEDISVSDFLAGECPDPEPSEDDELILISRIDLECMEGDWDVARNCDEPDKNGDILAVIEMIMAHSARENIYGGAIPNR